MSQSTEDNKQIARQFPEEVATKGNLDLLDEIVATDAVDHVALGREVNGREEFKALMKSLRSAFPDFRAEVEDIIAEGDLVSMRVHLTGTHEGEFLGMEPTGKSFDVQNLVVSRIEDGMIVERWVHPDVVTMLRQLGIEQIPSPQATP